MNLATLPNEIHPTLPLLFETENLEYWNWKSLLAIALVISLLYLIFYFIKAQREKPELKYLKKRKSDFDIQKKIYEIRKRTIQETTYLNGVLELSKLLREYIQEVNLYPKPITAMTVEELKRILESKNTIQVFETLRDIQFSNSELNEEVFEEVVKKTESLSKEKYFASIKKR